MDMAVTSAVVDALLAEARAACPHECCGLLLGTADAITAHQPATNVHPAPETYFEIDPQPLIDAHRSMRNGGPRLLGYYHSHPTGLSEPSATDHAMAARDGMIWAIIGLGIEGDRVTMWRAGGDGLQPLPYRTADA